MNEVTIKRGDLDKPLRVTLRENGAATNLSGRDVFIIISRRLASRAHEFAFRRACVVEDAPAGKVRYDWQDGDTDTLGLFDCEFETIETATGKKGTYPNAGFGQITITEKLNDS